MIQILLTGGTIDKHYNPSNGGMEFKDSHIEQILEQGRITSNYSIEQLMFKDSLRMIEADRQLVANACKNLKSDKILITHGTDTMVETAQHIANKQPQLLTKKTIVLVGAMIPHEIRYSDAMFNIGFALGAVNALENGIYIAMNGEIFAWNNVCKNKQTLAFGVKE